MLVVITGVNNKNIINSAMNRPLTLVKAKVKNEKPESQRAIGVNAAIATNAVDGYYNLLCEMVNYILAIEGEGVGIVSIVCLVCRGVFLFMCDGWGWCSVTLCSAEERVRVVQT